MQKAHYNTDGSMAQTSYLILGYIIFEKLPWKQCKNASNSAQCDITQKYWEDMEGGNLRKSYKSWDEVASYRNLYQFWEWNKSKCAAAEADFKLPQGTGAIKELGGGG
jgi:hypothetical protein